MNEPKHPRVANPPRKPLMLYDGDCHFCQRWIERWHEKTGDAVDYATSQEAGAEFPELTQDDFARAVQFIESDGKLSSGAEAVFRALKYSRRGNGWLVKTYERMPLFAGITEAAYAFISRHRTLASRGTRLLWGDDVRRPTYFTARRWFLKMLGLTYLVAFISLWVQVDGLIGEHGLVPAGELLDAVRSQFGGNALDRLNEWPTLCWLNSSSAMLHTLCVFGTASAAVLTLGLVPIPALLVCFVCYLSLVTTGPSFFSYQWDILLLETGFLAFFIAPWKWRITRGDATPVSGIGLFLLKFLLFKLMFMSGVVKLTSGDDCWINLTALDYHYWTQPLPTVFAWFSDKHPEWFKKFSVAFCLFVEIIVPFFIWTPRRLRLIAAALLVALQIAIAITGNYCFFNLLTVGLCLLLIDDATIGRVRGTTRLRSRAASVPALVALIVTLPINFWLLYTSLAPAADWPRPLAAIYSRLEPFRLANGYGLFRVMTRERPEIIIEGSADGAEWKPYEFKWKPGDVQRAPQWNAPHQPRLDWAMWFAALGSDRDRVTVERLVVALLHNEHNVLSLLGRNPFPNAPPQFIRATVFSYRFTTSEEHRQSGAWWRRTERAEYIPAISLRDLRER